MSLKALLFDIDGTLVDSDPIHIAVFIELLAEYDVPLTEADYMARIHGRTNLEIFADLLPSEDPQAMDLEKEARYRDRVGGQMEPLPGVRSIIALAKATGRRIGAVTNGPRANLETVLTATGLAKDFDCGVSLNDVARGKPDPEPYTQALALLKVTAGEALVFEDSPSGIRSAVSAGIDVVGVASALPAETLIGYGALFTIDDFTDPALLRHLSALEGAPA